MRTSLSVVVLTLLSAAPLFAQNPDTRGYLTGAGGLVFYKNISGFSSSGSQGTSDLGIALGARIKKHVMVVGNGGWMRNMQKGLQPLLVNVTNSIYNTHTIGTTGTGKLPVWHGEGGLSINGPTWGLWTPYVLGEYGIARMSPTVKITYNSGIVPGQTTAPPATGSDQTSLFEKLGYLRVPGASVTQMFAAAGGVRLAIAKRGIATGEWRYSRFAADSTLSTGAFSTNELAFGLGLRF
jgi:opacity protein-like surface antigen